VFITVAGLLRLLILRCFESCSLGKEIDFWRERSSSLASQLAETGKTYDSKLEHVLVAQESLSEQQQQVLRELSAALAAQQALAAAATAGATDSGSPGTGASNPVPPVLSPEQVCLSCICLVIWVKGPETVRFVRMTRRKICIALLTIQIITRTDHVAPFLRNVNRFERATCSCVRALRSLIRSSV
jgi:uncharacterized coiled-coil protein SlyX